MGTKSRRQEIPNITDEEQLHQELLKAFNAYYKENMRWKTSKSVNSCVKTRVLLSQIRHLCNQRRKILNDWRHDPESNKWKLKSEYSYIEKSISKDSDQEE